MKVTKDTLKLKTIFGQIADFRRQHLQLYSLESILVTGIISVLCGAESWNEMQIYAESKEEFLKTFLDLDNGIPSHDTFNRVFSNIDSHQFETCFTNWVSSLAELEPREVIAIDGKTIKGAKAGGKKSSVHMVSAWASANNLVLGQVKTDEKSNEITAIPELLGSLSLKDTIVTMDAMGCQKEIATLVRKKEADYILAVKGNQASLHQDIIDEFQVQQKMDTHKDVDIGHGRIETRVCSIIKDLEFIADSASWKDISTIIKLDSKREFKNSDKPDQTATRYYISSLMASAEDFQKAIRSHWSIENKLHWMLDVAFGEDASRKRTQNAAQNFSMLNKIALTLLKKEKSVKLGVKGRRLKSGWDNHYLIKVLSHLKV